MGYHHARFGPNVAYFATGPRTIFLLDNSQFSTLHMVIDFWGCLTALKVWIYIKTHFFFSFLPLNHTKSIHVGFNLLLATMKEETAIYNP